MPEKEIETTQKREQFSGRARRRVVPVAAIGLIVVIAVVAAVYAGSGNRSSGDSAALFGEPVAGPRSYVGKLVPMTPVEPVIEGDWVNIPLETLEEKDIVYFEVENNARDRVPMMAYITPSGRVFAGTSMCEPCRGRHFSLAGETLVCDSCRTTYTIEGHEFISGSKECGSYPPVYMEPEVKNGVVKISRDRILKWRPRAF